MSTSINLIFLFWVSQWLTDNGEEAHRKPKMGKKYISSFFHTMAGGPRDGKVRFGPVLLWILENPEPDYWFGPKRSGSGS